LSSQVTFELPINKKYGIYLSGRKSYLKLLLQPLLNKTINDNAENELNNMNYDFHDLNLTFIGQLSSKNKLLVDAFYSHDKLNIQEEEIAMNGYLKWENLSLSANLKSDIGKNNLEQYLTYSNYKNSLKTSQSEMILNILSEIEDIGYKNKLKYTIKDIPFESGLGYNYYNILPQESTLINSEHSHTNNIIAPTTSHSFFAFTSSRININQRIILEPGIRYSLFNSKYDGKNRTFNSLDLRLSGRYRIKTPIYLRFGYSHNTQYLNKLTPSGLGLPTDFWVAASNAILPQKGDELSIGYYHSLKDGDYEISTDLYYRKMQNISEFNQSFIENNNLPLTDKIHFGKGQAFGAEFMIKRNIGKVTGWISYAIGKSDRKLAGLNNNKPFPAKFDRTHDLSIVLSYTLNNKWDGSLVYKYATGNAYTQPSSWYFINGMPIKDYDKYNGSRMPAYNRTDISINYWFKKDNGINFSVYNMFMVNNPIYVFLLVRKDPNDNIKVEVKNKKLFTIIPSLSWKFKF
jgi:hypothetical protein